MPEMTTHQRMTRAYEHREADRVPVTDSPWAATVELHRNRGYQLLAARQPQGRALSATPLSRIDRFQ